MALESAVGKTLLVVEDAPVTREELAVLLQREGYTVVLAENGRQALDYLRQGPLPNLILLDIRMPPPDSQHFLEQLKEIDPGASIPVIIGSVGSTGHESSASHGAESVAYTIEFSALLDEIRRCLPR